MTEAANGPPGRQRGGCVGGLYGLTPEETPPFPVCCWHQGSPLENCCGHHLPGEGMLRREVKWGEEKASEVVGLLLLFQFLVFINRASDY